jgi:hypothetical protein
VGCAKVATELVILRTGTRLRTRISGWWFFDECNGLAVNRFSTHDWNWVLFDIITPQHHIRENKEFWEEEEKRITAYILSCGHNTVVKEGINQSLVSAVPRLPRLYFVAVYLFIYFWNTMANIGDEVARLREQLAAIQEQFAASEERFAASQEQLAATQEQLAATQEQSQERFAASQEQLAATQGQLRDAVALLNGTYYSTLGDVFVSSRSMAHTNPFVFTSLKRDQAPPFVSRSALTAQQLGPAYYTVTQHWLEQPGWQAAVDSTRSTIANAKAIFPKDIFNEPCDENDLAHLIPHGPSAASTYVDVAIWALGLDIDASWEKVQKGIHGAKQVTSDTRRSNRENHTGIKHFISNKVCLQGQRQYLDKLSSVYIIPVMTVEQMRAWNGDGYSAIAITADARTCVKIGMLTPGAIASPNDINLACTLLKSVILGMAHWLQFRSSALNPGDIESRTRLDELRRNFMADTIPGVAVPHCLDNAMRVRIVQFYHHTTDEGHPAPDPMFLAAKAAHNWSQTHGRPLKAAPEPQSGCDDELDDLALEQYLEWRQDFFRPKTWDDLARGLGQPHGYQERAQEEENA